jgi:uncharacterized protein
MKSLICSDIHDHVENLRRALELGVTANCESILCCGDLCSPFVLDVIHKYCPLPVHVVFGNNDGDKFNINKKGSILNANRDSEKAITLHGEFLLKESYRYLPGIPNEITLAMYHYPELAKAVFDSGKYDFVFYGHTHKISLEQDNKRLLANPGSIMGYIPGKSKQEVKPSCIIIDWVTRQADVIEF